MNLITSTLKKKRKLLSIYFTAGFPAIDDTNRIIRSLERSGVDMIEIGLPFSDPLADGPTIQQSSEIALRNGMTTETLFEQLQNLRHKVQVPLLIMGYFNPILQFGVEPFCRKCRDAGISGLIIPDLPVEEYLLHYQGIFKEYGILPIFLITPQTSVERIKFIDSVSEGFIYMVSSAGVTGGTDGFGKEHTDYFQRIVNMNLETPTIVGFGIKDSQTFKQATSSTHGAIIGSAFIKHLQRHGTPGIPDFIHSLK